MDWATFWAIIAMHEFLKPYTLAGFELGIFCSVGGRDDHYATPQGWHKLLYPGASPTPSEFSNAVPALLYARTFLQMQWKIFLISKRTRLLIVLKTFTMFAL
jgi:hypothetical protein